jgi:tRNA G18 (ribose-2'-O)-methylase SpoU
MMMHNIQLNHSQHQEKAEKYPICFLAHNIDVPMNVGSFFRIADALGVEKIYLTGRSVIPPNAKIKKTSRSSEQHVAFSYEENPLDVVARLKSCGYQIISLEITTSSIDIKNLSFASGEKICLVLGAESEGVSQALLDVSNKTVHIPMCGVNSSMNVATACSIATYEIVRKFQQ